MRASNRPHAFWGTSKISRLELDMSRSKPMMEWLLMAACVTRLEAK